MAKSKFEMAIDGLHQMEYYGDVELIEAMDRGYVIQPTYKEDNPLFQNPEYLRIYKAKHPEYGRVPASKYSQSNLDEVTRILKAFGLTWKEFRDYVKLHTMYVGMYIHNDLTYSFTKSSSRTAIGVIAGFYRDVYICALNWKKVKATCRVERDHRECEWNQYYNDDELKKQFNYFSTSGTNSRNWRVPQVGLLSDIVSRPEFTSNVLPRLGLSSFVNVLCDDNRQGFGLFTSGVGYTEFRKYSLDDWTKDALFMPVMALPPKKLGNW